MTKQYLAALAATLVLAACGGGDAASTLRAPAAAAPRATSATFDFNALLDWAPTGYPQFFHGGTVNGTQFVDGWGTFTFRHWPDTGNYVGILDGTVYAYGPLSQWQILPVGPLESFRCQVNDCSAVRTSYSLLKESGLAPQPQRSTWDLARTYLDADGDGTLEVFSAQMTYNPQTSTPQTASASVFRFYRKQGDVLVEAPDLLPQGTQGCIHPRKAVLADFNGDGKLDIFVACHGYDAMPFPGERNKLVLSQPDGTYSIRDAHTDTGFFHSAAAADFNGDGKPDVVVTNNMAFPSVRVWLNDGAGNFTPTNAYLPAALNVQANYFTVDVPDVDGDGKFDLFVGGHEWENAPTRVFLNPGHGDFSSAQPVTLPAVANEGVVLDVVVGAANGARSLWVLRTSGGDGTFYQSLVIQRVAWPTLESATPMAARGTQWQPWMIPVEGGGVTTLRSDDRSVTSINVSIY